MQRKVLPALGERDSLELLVRPVAREGGLDLGEDAEPIERTGFELFERDVRERRGVVAASKAKRVRKGHLSRR